ncbi:uncharacterized protein Bfra_002528 [Botrytis fragariae]|uniref:Uncharacterized protein n=1 Tax=Botrytis fragariae TaxID=1964551 RepID=A0A8H6AYH3_9HELO|nr:uncharacterized protein Bfra_002528 [Botrytis fragariae]KAF5876128.1 hypothetical protein Bfra_002528 [Botrytis fragariae]
MEDGFCKKIDLNLNISIDLPADAPEGHPHLPNVKRPRNDIHPEKCKEIRSTQIEFPKDLSLINVIATTIFDWKPAALHHLLNLETNNFIIVGITAGAEVSYRICNDQKWEIISAQNHDTKDSCIYWVPLDPVKRCACDETEKRMAQLVSQQYLVDVVFQNMIFPVLIYEPEAKSTKRQKLKGFTTSELIDVWRESNTGSSSDTLMEGNTNARVAELEAQILVLKKSIKELTGPARKRRWEDQSESVPRINLEWK